MRVEAAGSRLAHSLPPKVEADAPGRLPATRARHGFVHTRVRHLHTRVRRCVRGSWLVAGHGWEC